VRYGPQGKVPARLSPAVRFYRRAEVFLAVAIFAATVRYGWWAGLLVAALTAWLSSMLRAVLAAVGALFTPLEG
jgi:hypothetical protein